MAVIQKQPVTQAGIANVAFVAAAAGGDLIDQPDGDTLVMVKNGSAAPCTVTFDAPGTTPSGQPIPDTPLVVPITTGLGVIRLGPEYKDGNGQCAVTYSAVATVTIAVLQV